MAEDKLLRQCIANTITGNERYGGVKLTDSAKAKAVEHAAQFVEKGAGKGLNWGQLADIGVQHVVGDILKKG
jgi:hypothetical protein